MSTKIRVLKQTYPEEIYFSEWLAEPLYKETVEQHPDMYEVLDFDTRWLNLDDNVPICSAYFALFGVPEEGKYRMSYFTGFEKIWEYVKYVHKCCEELCRLPN